MYRMGKYSAARFTRDATVFMATTLLTLTVAVWAAAQTAPAAPTPPGATQPAAPTGGGPTGAQAAPTPPTDQRVILPSASGYVNSAAPTMQRNCEAASPDRPGTATPDGTSDNCMPPVTPADEVQGPQQSN